MDQAIYRVAHRPINAFEGPNAPAVWQGVEPAHVDHFHPSGSTHRPTTAARLVHHDAALRIRFDVRDCYVVARQTRHQQIVSKDSCVEFFLRPRPTGGYFNFEFNCCGVMLIYYIEDWRRTPTGFQKATPLTAGDLDAIQVKAALEGPIEPEQVGPQEWWVEALIPLPILERYCGPLSPLTGRQMTGNFYKCADRSSHPHWGSWCSIGEKLSFHEPDRFGSLVFE